ncbi:MAG: ribosome-associated translation inhibitor RaiA [Candidatus Omnitrophica bacterium]|nr:ribosome-associated translation inhibitor RaiA [Candidatus Omnitrophota bacterium]
MNLTISGRKIEVTQSLRQHAEDKIKKALKYSDKIIDAHVVMSMEKYIHTVEITFNLEGKTIFAKESSGDMYTSVDLAINKIIKQLRRYHDRLKDHKVKIKAQEAQEDRDI